MEGSEAPDAAPAHPLPPQLIAARERANTLTLLAEAQEAEARRARKRAKSAQSRYAALLRRYQGEDPLPLSFERD